MKNKNLASNQMKAQNSELILNFLSHSYWFFFFRYLQTDICKLSSGSYSKLHDLLVSNPKKKTVIILDYLRCY